MIFLNVQDAKPRSLKKSSKAVTMYQIRSASHGRQDRICFQKVESNNMPAY